MTAPAIAMRGVTLVEMAIVLLILGILTKVAIGPLSAVQAHRQHREATMQLEAIRQSLWAHVVSKGVLPCPVTTGVLVASDNSELCRQGVGGVPARALGLPGQVEDSGALLDPWNRPYRLVVSLSSQVERGLPEEPDWTSPGEASRVGIASLQADIVVCQRAVSGRCPDAEIRASELTFVVFTLGEDPSSSGDQSENLDEDKVYTVQEHSVIPERPFDDLLLWGSSAETLFWQLRAGWLP